MRVLPFSYLFTLPSSNKAVVKILKTARLFTRFFLDYNRSGMKINIQINVARSILVGLITVVLMLSGCADGGEYSSDDVMLAFHESAKNQTLPDTKQQEYFRMWFPQVTIGEVKHIESNTYELRFADISWEGEEIWGIDMSNSKIQPVNGAALMSAIYMFCGDKESPNKDCEMWIRQLQKMAEDYEQSLNR